MQTATASVALAFGAYLSLIGLVAADTASGNPSYQTSVKVERNGGVFEIEARTRIAADPAVAWAVLTDYDGYAEFVPGMITSHHISEQPLRIKQEGEFGMLFLRKRVVSTLEVQEEPPSIVRFHAVDGNLRRLETVVRITRDNGHTILIYRSTIEPEFWVPPLFGSALVRRDIRAKLNAVADEIERRAAREILQ